MLHTALCGLHSKSSIIKTLKNAKAKFREGKKRENRHFWKILHEGFESSKFSSFEGGYFA